jgi:hypothetical protein
MKKNREGLPATKERILMLAYVNTIAFDDMNT